LVTVCLEAHRLVDADLVFLVGDLLGLTRAFDGGELPAGDDEEQHGDDAEDGPRAGGAAHAVSPPKKRIMEPE